VNALWGKFYDASINLWSTACWRAHYNPGIIGWWVISTRPKRPAGKGFEKRDMEPSLRGFLNSIDWHSAENATVVNQRGWNDWSVEMTSFIAILGAAGLASGYGTFWNFAKFCGWCNYSACSSPLKQVITLTAQGHAGTVNEIQIFNTILKTPDNKTVIIPNGGLSTGSMINYSTEKRRQR
jgi:small conductance mechanosensitive channel